MMLRYLEPENSEKREEGKEQERFELLESGGAVKETLHGTCEQVLLQLIEKLGVDTLLVDAHTRQMIRHPLSLACDEGAHSVDCQFFVWLLERERHLPLDTLETLVGEPLASSEWLRNPAGQWFVNKVYALETRLGRRALCLKVQHPWWNGTGKNRAEVLALRHLAPVLPCPRVLAHSGFPAGPTLDALRGPARTSWRLQERRRALQSDPAADCQWLLMERVPGVCLGSVWDSLRWSQRRPIIAELVAHLARAKRLLRFATLGLMTECLSKVIPGRHVDVAGYLGGETVSTFRQFIQLKLRGVQHNRVPEVLAILQEPRFDEVPIVMCLGDVAPKNVMVDADSLKITAFLDFEWAGPDFLGHDMSEIDYEGEESFTDCPEVSYILQSEFVDQVWTELGFDAAAARERDLIIKFSEQKDMDLNFQRLMRTPH